MEGTGGDVRDISRKLSKIRFTQEIARVDDFLSHDFSAERVLEKVALISGLSKVVEETPLPSSAAGVGWVEKYHEDASVPKIILHPEGSSEIDTVERLLQTCSEMVGRLGELQEEIKQESESMRLALSADHAGYSSRIGQTEVQLNQLQKSLSTLERQADDLVAFGEQVGTPFSDLRKQRENATKLADILDHLVIFSHCMDLSVLPPSFHNDEDIERSASLVQTLMAAIQSVADMEHGTKNELENQHNNHIGTLGTAWDQLILYLNVLDNRIVSHFDSAADTKNIGAMAYYKRVMDMAHGSFSNGSLLLISRYISRKDLFFSPEDLLRKLDLQDEIGSAPDEIAAGVHGGFDSTTYVEASRRITYACNHLLQYIREEISILEQIFGEDSVKAVSLFISRVFEETLCDAVNRSFSRTCFGGENTATELRESLRLICESYRKVYNLADEACSMLSDNTGNEMSAIELVESAMGTILAGYPALERRWHNVLGSFTVDSRNIGDTNLTKDVVLNLISMNEESVNRCVQIMPVNKRSKFIQDLIFCNSSSLEGDKCMSLLDFVGKYIMEHLQKLEHRTLRVLDNHAMWKDTTIDAQGIKTTVEQSFGAIVDSTVSASELIQCVKEHYTNNISLLFQPGEKDSWKALLGLQNGIEDHLAMILQSSIKSLNYKIGDLLHATQLKCHFLTDASNTSELESPTPPCLKVCAVLVEIVKRTKESLVSNNYISFVQELVRNVADTLESHFLKFFYSQGGALRLKQDIGAYSSCIAASQVPSVNRAFDDLAAMSNILVVGSMSVHEMVESVSYLGQDRVNRFRQRRFQK